MRELAANHCVAMLIDQHLQTDVVYVDYFGRRAATTSALAALALRTGAPVIPAFALPLPGGRYRFIYEHPVDFHSTVDLVADGSVHPGRVIKRAFALSEADQALRTAPTLPGKSLIAVSAREDL